MMLGADGPGYWEHGVKGEGPKEETDEGSHRRFRVTPEPEERVSAWSKASKSTGEGRGAGLSGSGSTPTARGQGSFDERELLCGGRSPEQQTLDVVAE